MNLSGGFIRYHNSIYFPPQRSVLYRTNCFLGVMDVRHGHPYNGTEPESPGLDLCTINEDIASEWSVTPENDSLQPPTSTPYTHARELAPGGRALSPIEEEPESPAATSRGGEASVEVGSSHKSGRLPDIVQNVQHDGASVCSSDFKEQGLLNDISSKEERGSVDWQRRIRPSGLSQTLHSEAVHDHPLAAAPTIYLKC